MDHRFESTPRQSRGTHPDVELAVLTGAWPGDRSGYEWAVAASLAQYRAHFARVAVLGPRGERPQGVPSASSIERIALPLDRGPLWQAIRASGSVPGLFPPIAMENRLLVDGGLVANMPSEIARMRYPNAHLVAVDVGDPSDVDVGGLDDSGVVNGWERLRRREHAGSASLARLLMRLTELGRDDSTEFADEVITPDVREFGLTDVRSAREIAERGYEAGRRALGA